MRSHAHLGLNFSACLHILYALLLALCHHFRLAHCLRAGGGGCGLDCISKCRIAVPVVSADRLGITVMVELRANDLVETTLEVVLGRGDSLSGNGEGDGSGSTRQRVETTTNEQMSRQLGVRVSSSYAILCSSVHLCDPGR